MYLNHIVASLDVRRQKCPICNFLDKIQKFRPQCLAGTMRAPANVNAHNIDKTFWGDVKGILFLFRVQID
jgi:hypothetical protein